jgi:dTMP kinase
MSYRINFTADFKRNTYKGLYVAVEGPDGSGKSSQVQLLKKYFEKKGKTVVLTSEPNDTLVIGKFIRSILQGKVKVPSLSIQYLMCADRAYNQENLIFPALRAGHIVISHRSFWSAVPYGLLDKGVRVASSSTVNPILEMYGILSLYHTFMAPDVTFYLDIPLKTSIERMNMRGEKREMYDKKAKVKKVIAAYKFLLKEFPKEFTVIDAERSLEVVTEDMIKKIELKFKI